MEIEAALKWNQEAVTKLMDENTQLRRTLSQLGEKETRSVPHEDIGRGTYWSLDVTFQRYRDDERIKIGNFCSIARGVTFTTGGGHNYRHVSTFPFDAQRTYVSSKHTTVGHDCWIGEKAYIGGGAELGNGVVVGACTVIVGHVYIPDFAIVTGNPYKVKGYRFDQPTAHAISRIAWWNWPDDLIRERMEWFYAPVEDFIKEFDKKEGQNVLEKL